MCKGTREQARIVVEVHKQKVINKRAARQTDQKGQAQIKGLNKGCLQQSLNNLAYKELSTENDHRSDGV